MGTTGNNEREVHGEQQTHLSKIDSTFRAEKRRLAFLRLKRATTSRMEGMQRKRKERVKMKHGNARASS